MTPLCKKCGGRHYNFKPCADAQVENEKTRLYTRANLTPTITPPEGFKPFTNKLENVRVYGGLQVIKSDLKREGWKEI